MNQALENIQQTLCEVSNLYFSYDRKQALEGINFTLEEGSITALVGPNGAGKSTLMRCLAGLEIPDRGYVQIFGEDVIKNPKSVQSKIGFLFDNFGLYDELTVRDVLVHIGGCHGLLHSELNSRINEVVNLLGLEKVLTGKCGALSRGWRQRVGVALTILHKPSLLILDEPASGLDPESRQDLSVIFKKLMEEGINILVSSHILAELEEYCTSMLVIRDGKIVEHVTIAESQKNTNVELVIVLARGLSKSEFDLLQKLVSVELGDFNQDRVQFTFEVQKNVDLHGELLRALINDNLPICEFYSNEKSLQNLYLEMSKK